MKWRGSTVGSFRVTLTRSTAQVRDFPLIFKYVVVILRSKELVQLVYLPSKMAFILGVGQKTPEQPPGRFATNSGFFIQPWGISNDLE